MCSADATNKEDLKATKRQPKSSPSSLRKNDSRARSTFRGCSGSNSTTTTTTTTTISNSRRASARKKTGADGGSALAKPRASTVSSSSAGWLRGTGNVPTVVDASRASHNEEPKAYEDLREPFIELVDIVQGMEADIFLLKTANKQQEKDLVELRIKNEQLEQAHAQLTKSHQLFSSSVVANLELVGTATAQVFTQAQQMDIRVEGYMDSIERMADAVGDKLRRVNLRTDTLAAGIECVRTIALAASHGVQQVTDERGYFADVVDTYATRIKRETDISEAELRRDIDGVKEMFLSKNGELTMAFEALVQLVSEDDRPASPPLDAAEPTSPSSKNSPQVSPGIREEEYGPPNDSPSLSTSSSATSFTLSDDINNTTFEADKGTTTGTTEDGFGTTLDKAFPSTASSGDGHVGAQVVCTQPSTSGG